MLHFPAMAQAGFGKLLRDARETLGWTQLELAERMQTSATTISNLEREQSMPSVEQVNALVIALHISPEQLLGAMGVRLTPPAAARLPRSLVMSLLSLDPVVLQGVTLLVEQAALAKHEGDDAR